MARSIREIDDADGRSSQMKSSELFLAGEVWPELAGNPYSQSEVLQEEIA